MLARIYGTPHGIHVCFLKSGEFLVCNSDEVQTDEVNAIAALMGDFVAYRAVGWRHLEVLAGILFFPSFSFHGLLL